MIWIDVIIVIVLVISFVSGIRSGVINALFNLAIFIIALVITGFYYPYLASILTFLPNDNWSNFFGFLLTIILLSVVLSILSLIPRHLLRSVWNGEGCFFGLIGGVFSVFNTGLGFTVFMILLERFPIVPVLNIYLDQSVILVWLSVNMNFIYLLLPATFRSAQIQTIPIETIKIC